MTATPIRFSSAREKANFEAGLKLANEKLAAARKSDAARKSAEANQNARLLTKRMGATLARTCFGIPDTQAEQLDRIAERAAEKALRRFEAASKPTPAKRSTPATKAAPAATPKAPAAVKSFSRLTVHHFGPSGGLWGS
jgi:hypothetical protein